MATLAIKTKPVDMARAKAAAMMHWQDDRKQDWHEIAQLTGHPKISFLNTTAKGTQRPKVRALHDGFSTRAFRYLESGMYSGLSSPNRPWAKFKLPNEADETHAVRVWLDECWQVIAYMLAASNFYRVARANYGELGKFGTAAGIMDEHWERGINCTALTAGEYAIDTNYAGEVDSLVRVCIMTTRQMHQAFVRQPDGSEDWDKVTAAVKQAWQGKSFNNEFTVYHLIEPNPDYREGVMGAKGMKWRSVKWQADTISGFLEEKGYSEQPFWAPRWKVYGTDRWGMGPGHDALPDMRELQFQAKRKGEVTDMVVKPPTQGPAKAVKITPGSHTAMASADAGKIEVVYTAPYQAIGLVSQDVKEVREAISEATYADLFMAISEREGVQPLNDLESTLRNDEKMTQLGPVIEGVNNDMLSVVVERAFGIASRGGMLPPPPEDIQGREVEIEFVSVLSQAQKMMGMGQTERSLAFIGAVAQYQPDVIDLVDGDALVADHWQRSGAPAVGLRADDVVEQIRAQRAQAQQMEKMAAMAAPAKDGIEAAALLNQIGQQ